MAQKDILLKNYKEYYDLAEFAFKTGKFNGAVTLYYKALVELCDLVLLEKTGRIGANHTERFSLMRMHNPELYSLTSKLFEFYRDSYSSTISEIVATQVKKAVDDAKLQLSIK